MKTDFEKFIAPLTANEFENLKASIQRDGCLHAIITWHGIILDGHNRYKICTELGIPYQTIELEFGDEEHAKLWMVQNQLARRNIKPFQKCEMVYPLEKIISEEVAKRKNQAISKARQEADSEMGLNLAPKTANIMAEYIDISPAQWKKAKYVIENGDEELKALVRSGKKSIHAAYKKLKDEKEDARPKSEKIDGFTPIGYMEKANTSPYKDPNRVWESRPFPIVRDDVRTTVETMLIELEACLNCVRDEDITKIKEFAEILKQGYQRAKKIMEERSNGKMVGNTNVDVGNVRD